MILDDIAIEEQEETAIYTAPQIEEIFSAEDIQREVTYVSQVSIPN